MKNIKYKHLSFEDRCSIQEFLNLGFNFTQISFRIGKHRTAISKEVYKHRFLRNDSNTFCPKNCNPPYVCNGCLNKNSCSKKRFFYDASIAHNEYNKTLIFSRANLHITKQQISSINDIIAPLMIKKKHSVNQVFINHCDILPFSKPTFYRYVDLGILNVRNIDLQRKVKFKVKKELDDVRPKTNTKIKLGRFYRDFQDYMELHPDASVVEMDTVIGTQGGNGGKCLLTMFFRKSSLMLIYLLPYKKTQYVLEIFEHIKSLLGIDEFKRLFEVILTDNGTEFSDPDSIEIDFNTGEKLISLFFCDPNCSWQKGSLEKNHEFIRYVLPKGSSFASLKQYDCNLLASHINSIPRVSLNNETPYNLSLLLLGRKNLNKFNISSVFYDDVNLSPNLLRK